jgi:starvation-inducible DNA-binding protein
METLYLLAKKAFATHYHYLLKAQNFHWNITGPDFPEFHELFGDIYEEVDEKTDKFAESLRAIKCVVPASFAELNELSDLFDPVLPLTKDEMVTLLYKDNGKTVKILLDTYRQAELDNEHGFSNFLAERLGEHRKHGWQLYSSMVI